MPADCERRFRAILDALDEWLVMLKKAKLLLVTKTEMVAVTKRNRRKKIWSYPIFGAENSNVFELPPRCRVKRSNPARGSRAQASQNA
jgi:hypothetical protein